MTSRESQESLHSRDEAEGRALSVFRTERTEDVVAMVLAAILVLAVLAGLRL
jgi:hypothetical protein